MKNTCLLPKMFIEKLLRDNIQITTEEIQVYCFNGIPELIVKLYTGNEITIYDNKLNYVNEILSENDITINTKPDLNINNAVILSKKISKDFLFVRVDWMIYKGKIMFEELTFTPLSGFHNFKSKKIYKKLSNLLKIGDYSHEF